MSSTLFESDGHVVRLFSDLATGEGIQANQLLITHGPHAALFDPGGDLLYTPLSMAIAKLIPIKELDYIFASHQDPDIIASLDKWLMYTEAKVVTSRLWDRFIPHFVPGYMAAKGEGRLIGLPDEGTSLPFGDSEIKAVPAHFLHSVGNFHFYDPVSKVLFSGDVGASLVDDEHGRPVRDFDRHIKRMQAFHERYMVSNKVCRLWANMVRSMDVEMIVPQHGRPFVGRAMVQRFLDWFETVECGIDRMDQAAYRVA